MPGQVWYEPWMLTRSQVAQRIGRSIATVRRMEGRSLHPRRSRRGTWIFDSDEVEAVAEEVARSGRALDCDTLDLIEDSVLRSRAALGARASEMRRLRHALNEVARMKELLRQAATDRDTWTAHVEEAVEIAIAAIGASDEEMLAALTDLANALRR